MKRRRIQFDDEIHDKLLEKQDELKKIVPSTTYSDIVNHCLKQFLSGMTEKKPNLFWRYINYFSEKPHRNLAFTLGFLSLGIGMLILAFYFLTEWQIATSN